ncbi:hypothetical protein [Desulfoluna sp.]|uniref:hypothetical protein n=1 Tax=Desulfoluna sp. TaxID=2045199 RepID=UPI0026025BE3|nr:hypothetical protein [Desulfoluna sp.]
MKIHVSCYAGYRGEETPRMITLGENVIQVEEVLDQWLAPDHRYFKCRGDDGGEYLIRHDVASGQWKLTYFSLIENLSSGKTPH